MEKDAAEMIVPWRHTLPSPGRLDERQTRGLLRKKYRENRRREREEAEGRRFRSAFEILRGMDVFAPVSDGELVKFAALGRERRVARGRLLRLDPAPPDPPLALILEGEAMLAWGRGPEELLLRALEPGDLVGETELFASGAAHRPHNSWRTRPRDAPLDPLQRGRGENLAPDQSLMIREPAAPYRLRTPPSRDQAHSPGRSAHPEKGLEFGVPHNPGVIPLDQDESVGGGTRISQDSPALFEEDEATAGPSTRALTPVRLMEWELDAVREALRRWPDVAVGLLGGMARRQDDLQRRVAGLCGGRAPRRLARALAALLRERGVPWREGLGRRGWRLMRTPSRTRLGSMTGLARETVSRLLAAWTRQGWITAHEGDLVVLDRASWCRLTGGDGGAERRDGRFA